MATATKKRAKKKVAARKGASGRVAVAAAPVPGKRRGGIALLPALQTLTRATAEERIAWGLRHFPTSTVLTSSFGAQSAVLLHMATRQRPDLPVVLLDTGYLFPETYKFIDELTERLSLNLKVYRPLLSASWQEARYGKLWEQGLEGINLYNQMNKLEPMDRAVRELKAKAWISGVRRGQSEHRDKMEVLGVKNGLLRLHPLIDWTDKHIFDYLTAHNLPYHPLWSEGYTSIGDWHTSHRLTDGDDPSLARFHGLKRECGLHEETKTVAETGDFVI
jgi:phosphoadenosine phosphosulfate reductase